MIKLRITGEDEEVKDFMKLLRDMEPFIKVLSESENYKNRNSEYIRKYVELRNN
jgi:hypothetical protein